MLRYDTAAPFDDPAAWDTHVPVDNSGFDGGFFDGRYVYYVPFTRAAAPGESVFHGTWLRYDTAAPFDDPAAWDTHDASHTDGLHTTAYNAGAFDGRYFYTAPWRGDRDGSHAHGRVQRYDTLGADGAFSLRYGDVGHNGGLCAAVPGPSFTVNTTGGAVSIAAHQTLAPGVHHLAGVYDGAAHPALYRWRARGLAPGQRPSVATDGHPRDHRPYRRRQRPLPRHHHRSISIACRPQRRLGRSNL